MATIHINLATVAGRGYAGALPIPSSVPVGVDTYTSTGTSGLSTLSAEPGQVWIVTSKDGDVWAKFGAGTPVAAAEDGWLITAGQTREFTASVAAEKLAIKDA